MAILSQCFYCKRKQSSKNKRCNLCGESLDKQKRSQKVKYWISYRMPDGTQRRESVSTFKDLNGYSIEDARVALSKRKVQKKEKRIMDMLPPSKMTFNELTDWYITLPSVKKLASYELIKIKLNIFNSEFGCMVVNDIMPVNLENYQTKRIKDGVASGTIDQEIGKVRAMIYKAFDNDLVGVNAIKTFKKIKKLLKPGSDVRDRILSPDEFKALMKHAKGHLKPIIATGYHTGMRKGEILNLTWDKVDLANKMIRLEAGDTKDKEARNVPINDELYKFLVSLPNRLKNTNEDEDNHVFQYKGEKIKSDIRDSLKKACKKAGIKYGRFVKCGFIFHDLRHTFNTNMRKAGVPESVIMKITGHSTREMFDRYNTIDDNDRHHAVNEMSAYLKSVDQTVDHSNKKSTFRK